MSGVSAATAQCHKQTSADSFDRFTGEQSRWDNQPERLGRLQVDDEPELRWQYDRQVGGLLARPNLEILTAPLSSSSAYIYFRQDREPKGGGNERPCQHRKRNCHARHCVIDGNFTHASG